MSEISMWRVFESLIRRIVRDELASAFSRIDDADDNLDLGESEPANSLRSTLAGTSPVRPRKPNRHLNETHATGPSYMHMEQEHGQAP